MTLPEFEVLNQVLSDGVIELPARQLLVRAAWNDASVWPIKVNRAYRFGPPDELLDADGTFPFHWLYAADDVFTAVWEARLCDNDVTRPGTFQFARKAEQALIASLRCARPLRLLGGRLVDHDRIVRFHRGYTQLAQDRCRVQP